METATPEFGLLLVELGLVTRAQLDEALAIRPDGSRLSEQLVSSGFITRIQLQRAISLALERGIGGVLSRPPLGEVLLGLGRVTQAQLNDALESQRQSGRRLGDVLLAKGFVGQHDILEALGLQQRMAHPGERPAAAPTPGQDSGPRVLVVDDSELACAMVHEGLALRGYEVHTFTDAYRALERLDALKPDVLLTDLDMPGIDGAELCKRVKAGPFSALPVVILTANDADAQRVGLLRAGADDYVHKGASMDELAARLESVLRRTRETERMRRLFARYTSDAVVEEVLAKGDVVLSGEKREVTILFADVRNFTGLAETLPAEKTVALLNSLLGGLADVVMECGGTLDKFLGDGLMAVWGAPVRHDDDAQAAVGAALEMLQMAQRRNVELPGGPPMELGVGINTGFAVAGSIGSTRRTEYTCIGDAVNVAARLCALAGPGEVLLGESAAAKLGRYDALEALPPVRLKGRAQLVPLFRINPAAADSLQRHRRF